MILGSVDCYWVSENSPDIQKPKQIEEYSTLESVEVGNSIVVVEQRLGVKGEVHKLAGMVEGLGGSGGGRCR